MPIKFSKIGGAPNWQGHRWTVIDDDQLAEFVARIALGQSRYVRRVLVETGVPLPPAIRSAKKGAVKLLTAADPDKPWHRDGWLFQTISWIVRHLQNPGDPMAPPHMIHAHKGFDGIHVALKSDKKRVLHMVICEEKATDNPRKMIIDRVWKEFKELEQGDRDNELVDILTQLLSERQDIDPDKVIEAVIWKNARAYRVAVTIDDSLNDPVGYDKLFSGYEKVVDGNVSRRRGEVFYLKNLRLWMSIIAKKALEKVEELESKNV